MKKEENTTQNCDLLVLFGRVLLFWSFFTDVFSQIDLGHNHILSLFF